MKAVVLEELGSPPVVRRGLPDPTPGPGELLVRVRASAVNPMDNAIVAGMVKDMVEHVFPITLGRDFAGVVEEVGADVSGLVPGDEVFGFVPAMTPVVHAGSWAELIAVPDSIMARKPEGVDTAIAGAAPLAAVTATTCIDALDLSEGETVLVIGATGGVGSVAVQLAAAAGATVTAPGLSEDEEYLRGLGVAEVVPRAGDVVAAVRERHPDGVDALVDAVSFTPGAYDGALEDGARVSSPTNAAGEGPGRTNVMSAPAPEILERIARHLADGTLEIHIQQTYELDQAPEAMQALAAGHTRGKLGIRVA
jgi:NADPH:quinone reductase